MSLTLKQRGAHWHMVGSVCGVTIRETTGCTLDQEEQARIVMLERELEERQKRLGESVRDRKKKRGRTVAHACEEFRRRPEGVGASDQRVLDWMIADMGKVLVRDVTTASINKFADERWGKRKPGTRKRCLTIVRSVLNREHRMGHLKVVPHVEMPTVNDERHRDVSEAERNALIGACAGPLAYMRPLVVFLLYTGARVGEALRLTARDFKTMDAKRADGSVGRVLCVTFVSRKGGTERRRMVVVPSKAEEAIECDLERAKTDGRRLFLNSRGEEWQAGDGWGFNIYKSWDEVCAKAGIADLRPHDLRHDYANRLRERGADIADVQDLLGHANITTTRRYLHKRPGRANALVELL